MELIKVASAVLNQTPIAWAQNKANILEAIRVAKAQSVGVLCLPEMCITGYGCEDAFHSALVRDTAVEMLLDIASETKGIAVSVGLPILYRNALFNTACLIVDGRIAGFAAKQFLAGDGIYYEPRWFKPWPAGTVAQIEIGGTEYPLGDIFFDCGGVRIGFEICEDAWVAQRPGSDLSLKAVDIILNPSASHFGFGRFETRKRFVLEGSRAFGVSYVYSNLLGNDSGRAIFDGGTIIASLGKTLALGPRLSFQSMVLTTAVIDLDVTRTAQARTGSFKPVLGEEQKDCIKAAIKFPKLISAAQRDESAPQPKWESSCEIKYEEFLRAVSLGLFDYLRKSRLCGFVVSLSGGADSSCVACLVSSMVTLGTAELGLVPFCAALGSAKLEGKTSRRDIVAQILVGIYQSTKYSSETTYRAAEAVADALGAEFMVFDVDPVFEQYIKIAERSLGRPLTWEQDDVALQNIQARVRSPSAWLIANVRNALLLSTSNRSEAAVGYATMDGDTSGSLSPIAGIDKAFVRAFLRWLEQTGPEGLNPIPQLAAVNVQQPTAELRPHSEAQTDEKDLMPYELLNRIERAAVLEKQSPVEIFECLKAECPQYKGKQLAEWIERFFRLWCRNQWKRERYAPSFHLDDESLDPKTWCRFPILSGGFEKELQELRDLAAKEG